MLSAAPGAHLLCINGGAQVLVRRRLVRLELGLQLQVNVDRLDRGNARLVLLAVILLPTEGNGAIIALIWLKENISLAPLSPWLAFIAPLVPPSTHTHLDGLLLLIRGMLQHGADHPRALVVLDVGADLADDGGVAVGIQVVILDLQAHRIAT